jgi:predicted nucleic-acid-binding Zn-ribbon protein
MIDGSSAMRVCFRDAHEKNLPLTMGGSNRLQPGIAATKFIVLTCKRCCYAGQEVYVLFD